MSSIWLRCLYSHERGAWSFLHAGLLVCLGVPLCACKGVWQKPAHASILFRFVLDAKQVTMDCRVSAFAEEGAWESVLVGLLWRQKLEQKVLQRWKGRTISPPDQPDQRCYAAVLR